MWTPQVPKLTEEEKKESELIVQEGGMEFHFYKGDLVYVYPEIKLGRECFE